MSGCSVLQLSVEVLLGAGLLWQVLLQSRHGTHLHSALRGAGVGPRLPRARAVAWPAVLYWEMVSLETTVSADLLACFFFTGRLVGKL